jgi:hypothetical protein
MGQEAAIDSDAALGLPHAGRSYRTSEKRGTPLLLGVIRIKRLLVVASRLTLVS